MPLEHSGRGDEKYVTVTATLLGISFKAVRIRADDVEGWLARSCLHFSTDKAVDKMDVGDEAEFKMMKWVATKNGFL